MTVSAIEAATGSGDEAFHRSESECTISAEGMYAARLVRGGAPGDAPGRAGGAAGGSAGGAAGPGWYPERWTLGGPEPYRVALPTGRPEAPGSEVLPMSDGRVLIHRPEGRRHAFALLHPTSPGTREIPLGALDCPAYGRDAGDDGCTAHPEPRPASPGPLTPPARPAPGRGPGGPAGPDRAAGRGGAIPVQGAARGDDAAAPDGVAPQGRDPRVPAQTGADGRRPGTDGRTQAVASAAPQGAAPQGSGGLGARAGAGGGAQVGGPAAGRPVARRDLTACQGVRLLPPVPGGRRAYALAVGPRSTALWLVAGETSGPRRLAEIPGRCSGGTWLERTGRLLALDQQVHGRVKTVTVDLGRGCAVSPLLEIAEGSTDRLLLADPDSGLLLIRSDAPSPGHERLAWGVLGSTLPVRFPECLRLPDYAVTPFAIQPGQVLTPERCAVALRVDGAAGTWLAVWRPAERTLHHVPAPDGWLTGCGTWSREGTLSLPYATRAVPCGLARLPAPPVRTPAVRTAARSASARGRKGTVLARNALRGTAAAPGPAATRRGPASGTGAPARALPGGAAVTAVATVPPLPTVGDTAAPAGRPGQQRSAWVRVSGPATERPTGALEQPAAPPVPLRHAPLGDQAEPDGAALETGRK